MKIKVVDMPYEQALAQPREKHTLPRRPSMLFRALLRATHFRCDRVGMERLGPDEPCLVLMNHSCFLDLKIAAAVLYPRPFNIVCTSDGFVGKAGLMRALGCIPTRKFQPDTALVRDMLYAVKKLKSSILLYPEASYSFDGTATPLPESIGKCVKALGVPVVLETDAKSKCDKYVHLGMELAGTRRFGTYGVLYDLIKYPDAPQSEK